MENATSDNRLILVLGATGQQGGSVAVALKNDGWHVRTLVRDTNSIKARALSVLGVETVPGDLTDTASLRAAAAGAYGVFSVQPSSGQAEYGVSDADEVRFGIAVADVARDAGVHHLIYTSSNAAGPQTGVGHFDTKWQIENYVRSLAMDYTIIRPGTFMELLLLPDFGLARGQLTFFMKPDQAMQFIAVEDIGQLVVKLFADRVAYRGQTIELAGDSVTGADLAAKFSRAINRPVAYQRFPDAVLGSNQMLKGLARLVDEGPLAGTADVDTLRKIHPGLLTFDAWLERTVPMV